MYESRVNGESERTGQMVRRDRSDGEVREVRWRGEAGRGGRLAKFPPPLNYTKLPAVLLVFIV